MVGVLERVRSRIDEIRATGVIPTIRARVEEVTQRTRERVSGGGGGGLTPERRERERIERRRLL